MPYNYFTTSGIIVADTSTIKAEVQGEYVSAFGPSLLLADETPQGRLIDVETTSRDAFMRLMAEVANQINPNINSGIYQESVCALHAIIPTAETFTVLPDCLLEGTVGTVIPANSRIADPNGNFYATVTQVTFDGAGQAFVDMQALVAGTFNPAINTVVTIIDGVLGWATVTNPTLGTPGSVTETPNALRTARNDKLSQLGKGTVEAISSNVLNVPNVRSISIRENVDPGATVIDGVAMTAHSTWLCVQGGIDTIIAQAMLNSKQTGSPWTSGVDNGTPVLVGLIDPISGQTYPLVFTRPEEIPVGVRVTVSSGSAIDATTAVPNAVLTYANGLLAGERGFVNGAAVSPFEVASAINVQYPELFIKKVEVATIASGPAWAVAEVPIDLWQHATVTSGNIFVVVV